MSQQYNLYYPPDPPENFDPRALPFKVTQGHLNRHKSIGSLTSY